MIHIENDIAVAAHAKFFHIAELTQAMAGFHALDEVVVIFFRQSIDEVNRCLVGCENIRRSENADIRRDDRLSRRAFAVTRNRHVAQHVDVGNVVAKMVSRCFRRFRDTLHEFFLADAPLRTRIAGMNHLLADAAVGAANADVLVGTAEAAHRMALKMRKDEQRES